MKWLDKRIGEAAFAYEREREQWEIVTLGCAYDTYLVRRRASLRIISKNVAVETAKIEHYRAHSKQQACDYLEYWRGVYAMRAALRALMFGYRP